MSNQREDRCCVAMAIYVSPVSFGSLKPNNIGRSVPTVSPKPLSHTQQVQGLYLINCIVCQVLDIKYIKKCKTNPELSNKAKKQIRIHFSFAIKTINKFKKLIVFYI